MSRTFIIALALLAVVLAVACAIAAAKVVLYRMAFRATLRMLEVNGIEPDEAEIEAAVQAEIREED